MLNSPISPGCDIIEFKRKIKEGIDSILYRAEGSDKLAEAIYNDIAVNMIQYSLVTNDRNIVNEINNIIHIQLGTLANDINNVRSELIHINQRLSALEKNYSLGSANQANQENQIQHLKNQIRSLEITLESK